jgi:hypothetical protein
VPLDIAKFNSAYVGARFRIEDGEADIAGEQARLRELVPDDAAAEDREWALGLIDTLAEPPEPPRELSALYHQAVRVQAEAYEATGSTEEKIAAFERARREIFAIADRAAPEEAPDIRAMTRSMEHLENALRDPLWPAEDPPGRTD